MAEDFLYTSYGVDQVGVAGRERDGMKKVQREEVEWFRQRRFRQRRGPVEEVARGHLTRD